MFSLRVLGGLALEGPEGPVGGRPAHKRRLALLALLAMSRTGRLGREKLIGYLWPDKDEESARHLLSDAVYVLNRTLGSDALTGPGDELRLNPARLQCDGRAFESAAADDPEAAVRLYAGPFLDGFFLEGSEEFETWAGRERERLAALAASALERLATSREAAGDERGAIEAWRRLSAEDPYNSKVAARLARALAQSGDRAGALQSTQLHADRLRKDLGLHAPPDLRELIASLQAAPAAPADTGASGAPPAPTRGEQPAIASSAPVTADERSPLAPAESGARDPASAPGPRPSPPGGDVERAARPDTPNRVTARRRLAGLAAVVMAAAAVLAWLAPWRRPGAAGVTSIAVMPFEDLGGDRAGSYLGDGIADELTTHLGRGTPLKVAARTSAFALKGRQMDAREIGRALGVDAFLEGSVHQAGDRVRIAVRLVNTGDGYQMWSESWDRPLGEVAGVPERIAREVLQVAGVASAGDGNGVRTAAAVPPAAYHLYLQGRYFWHQRTRDSLTRAATQFEQAAALAPDYAEAFSGLADAYAVMGFYDYLRPAEAFPRAKVAAERALALDPRLAQAHASLGYVALYYDWDRARAEASFERAIALNPSYSVGHQWYGNLLTAGGRFDEAVAAMRRAQEVDPLSLIASAALGWVHFYRRDFDAAVDQCRRTLELNPGFELAHLWAGWAHGAAGRSRQAIDHLTTAVRLSADGAVALASLARAQAHAGERDAARRTLATLHRVHPEYLPAFELAKVHLALDERDAAIRWLERALAERSHAMVFLAVDPHLDDLRTDPRFGQLQSRIGPPPPAAR